MTHTVPPVTVTPPLTSTPPMPRKLRLQFWWRRVRFRWAIRLVGSMDGLVASRAAYEAALAALARFTEDVGDAFRHQPARAKALEARLESITELLTVATQAGDPSLQFDALMQLYGRARMASMSKRKRNKLLHLAGIRKLAERHQAAHPATSSAPVPAGAAA